MKNITVSLDEQLIKTGRAYAQQHHTSLNNLIRESLEKKVVNTSSLWIDECLSLIDKCSRPRTVKKWRREDLYAD